MVAWVGEGLPRMAPDSGPELAARLIQQRRMIDFLELSTVTFGPPARGPD